jgi:hypothetical protein
MSIDTRKKSTPLKELFSMFFGHPQQTLLKQELAHFVGGFGSSSPPVSSGLGDSTAPISSCYIVCKQCGPV